MKAAQAYNCCHSLKFPCAPFEATALLQCRSFLTVKMHLQRSELVWTQGSGVYTHRHTHTCPKRRDLVCVTYKECSFFATNFSPLAFKHVISNPFVSIYCINMQKSPCAILFWDEGREKKDSRFTRVYGKTAGHWFSLNVTFFALLRPIVVCRRIISLHSSVKSFISILLYQCTLRASVNAETSPD